MARLSNEHSSSKAYLTWEEVELEIGRIHEKLSSLPPFDITLMVPRGGVFPGLLLERRSQGHYGMVTPLYGGSVPIADRMLVVDDIWDSGDTLRSVYSLLSPHCKDLSVVTLACKQLGTPAWHIHSGRMFPLSEWVVFPWEVHDDSNLSVEH
jgi:hypoxanthine phosphoribosyltransferase